MDGNDNFDITEGRDDTATLESSIDNENIIDSTPLEKGKDKTTLFFLSPSAANICIACKEDITEKYPVHYQSYKKRLWKGNKKTVVCDDLERYYGKTILQNRDFQCIDQACYSKIKTQLKQRVEKQTLFEEGRELAEKFFVRSRSRQPTSFQPPTKTTKRKLLNTDDDEKATKQLRKTKLQQISVRIYYLYSEQPFFGKTLIHLNLDTRQFFYNYI